jgi:mono/diheme cytochrome c family protein
MPRTLLVFMVVLGAILLPLSGQAEPLAELKPLKLDIPTSDMMFPAGPGSDAINSNCLTCHSADHVLNQPPLPKETWEEVVKKMINAYKAPISTADAAAIVDYLTRVKGVP